MAPVWVSPVSPRPESALDRPDLNPSLRAIETLAKSLQAVPAFNHASCEISDTSSHDGIRHHPHAASAVDPQLQGRCILLVLPGGRSRHRLMSSMQAAGCRLVCYAPAISPWATAFVDDWVLGPIGDYGAALTAVQVWLHTEAAAGLICPPRENLSCLHSSDELGHGNGGEAVHCLGRRVAFDGVLSYDEYGIQLAAHLAQGLGLPVCGCASEPWAVAAVRSKRQFREACVAAGVPTPRYLHLGIPTAAPAPAPDACTLLSADRGRAEDADQLLLQLPKRLQAAGVRFPVVMKPVGGAGSFSVTRADDVGQLEAAVRGFWSSLPAYLSTSGQAADSPAATGGLLVEELIEGHEVDVDCIVVRGQLLFACVSDNHPCKRPSAGSGQLTAFVEAGGRCPSSLPDLAQAQLLALTARVVALFGDALSGVMHFEAMYNSSTQEAIPIELNARIGGAETFTNVLTAWGVDLARAALRISCGLPLQLPLHLINAHLQTGCSGIGAEAASPLLLLPLRTPPSAIYLIPSAGLCSSRQSRAEAHSEGGQPSASAVSPDLSGDDGEHVCGSELAGGRCGCGCPTTCCSAGRCCYWDFLSAPGAAGAQALLLRCLSEPAPELNNGGCLCAAKARSKLHHSLQQPQLLLAHDFESVSAATEHHEAAVLRCQAYSEAACSRRPSGSGGESEDEGACCSAGGIRPEPLATDRRQNGGSEQRPYCLSADDHQSCRPAQPHSCLTEALPLSHVHSINFLPDWEGWGVIQRLEVGSGARAHPGFVDAEVYGRPGDRVALPPAGFSALGWMVAQSSEGPEAAERAMQQMMEHVVIELGSAELGSA